MPKPPVYVETTVIGYLTARPQRDEIVAGHQAATKKWWQTARNRFELVVSQIVLDECAAGDATAAQERLSAIGDLAVVGVTTEVQRVIDALLAGGAVPVTEPADAAHIALAAVHGIQYLTTWNLRHIANASTRRIIEEVIRNAGYRPPVICSPEELLED